MMISSIQAMTPAKRYLWVMCSRQYGNDVWGCGIGDGPEGTTNLHLRLYVTRQDIKDRVLKSMPTVEGYPVHVIVENGPSATGPIKGELT